MCTYVLFQFYLEQIHDKTAPQVYRIDNKYVKPFIFRMHVHHKDPDTVLQFKKTYISQKKLKLSVKSAFRSIIRSNGERRWFLCHITNYIRRLKI